MSQSIFKVSVMLVLLCGTGVAVAEEDLDAALAAQKKKAQRRVYSEKARMDHLDLTVPRTKTEAEKELDKKLREMDAQAERNAREEVAQSLMNPQRSVSSSSMHVALKEDTSWLAAAISDHKASEELPDTTEDSWLTEEMDRQKALQASKKENEMVERLLREQSRLQTTPSGTEPFKTYQLVVPQGLGGDPARASSDTSFMTPKLETRSTIMSFGQTVRKEETPALSAFSPPAARQPFLLNQPPLHSTIGSSVNLAPGASSGSNLPWNSIGQNPFQKTPLTPLQKIKKSSLIYQSDPFTDDHMPKIKTSIWE